MTDTSTATAIEMVTGLTPLITKTSTDWVAVAKFLAAGFIGAAMLGLVLAGKIPATDFEILFVVPVLGTIGIHAASQRGANIAAKAIAQNPPSA